MRTAIFFGLVLISDAINQGRLQWDDTTTSFLGFFSIIIIVADITEFIIKIKNKK